MKKYCKHFWKNLLAALKHAGLVVVHVVHGILPGPTIWFQKRLKTIYKWLRKRLNKLFNKHWRIQ